MPGAKLRVEIGGLLVPEYLFSSWTIAEQKKRINSGEDLERECE